MTEKIYDFYGVCGNAYKLNDTVWEAIEDPSDGYRSYLSSIVLLENTGESYTFFHTPIASVKIVSVEDSNLEGWKLIDIEDGHVWLEVGTSQYDDYYPCFVFNYHAKSPDKTWENFVAGLF